MKLALSHIRKAYGGRPVLSDCSYLFERNGTHVLMGPNGSGKSTLLRILALLEQPDAGEFSFRENGAALPKDLALMRRITLVLPRTGVFNTTVFNNVAYGLRVRGLAKAAIELKTNDALSLLGLERKRHQPARTLSSGETQRMAIARALALEPEILFLDEPTASVDQEHTGFIESTIRTLQRSGRTLVLMTTHDREQAERLADRILFLRNGVIAE